MAQRPDRAARAVLAQGMWRTGRTVVPGLRERGGACWGERAPPRQQADWGES